MKQIRKGAFETNSSSMHSLVIENDKSIGKLEKSDLKLNKEGEIKVQLGEYGCFLAFLKTQQEKLNYLVTLIAGSKTIISREDLEDDPEFEYLKKQVPILQFMDLKKAITILTISRSKACLIF